MCQRVWVDAISYAHDENPSDWRTLREMSKEGAGVKLSFQLKHCLYLLFSTERLLLLPKLGSVCHRGGGGLVTKHVKGTDTCRLYGWVLGSKILLTRFPFSADFP